MPWPLASLNLAQAKEVSEKLFAFVCENKTLVTRVGTSRSDFVEIADALRVAIQRMATSTNSRQTSMSEYMSCSLSN